MQDQNFVYGEINQRSFVKPSPKGGNDLLVNTSKPTQNGLYFPYGILKTILLDEVV